MADVTLSINTGSVIETHQPTYTFSHTHSQSDCTETASTTSEHIVPIAILVIDEVLISKVLN